MILIVGLGNPGNQYKKTRHNVGFMILDKIKESINFPDFKLSKKYSGLISQGTIFEKEAILLKPSTFMNESGKAVEAIVNYFKIKPENIYIIQDEADVDLGKIKISTDANSAGHKGIQSIIEKLGTKKFTRFRIGINSTDKTYEQAIKEDGLESVVLKNFSEEEQVVFKKIAEESVDLIISTIKNNAI
ncbi:MAG: aminoacyl-tRNA hydrolase [Candidatus Paceibacterota bacterium]|jgi:PTH1 family peptidyl-tRNA hydrolase